MKKITLLLAGCALLLSGCAGVKSSFDCDATTSDTCMTMTKANQLARDKAAKQAGKPGAGALPSLVNIPAPAPAPVMTRPVVSSSVENRTPVTPVTTSSAGSLTPRPMTGSRVSNPLVRPVLSAPVATTVTTVAPSCQSVRCDSPGMVHPQRTKDNIATVWVAPWVDSDNAFHQPGRVSFVVDQADWVIPANIR